MYFAIYLTRNLSILIRTEDLLLFLLYDSETTGKTPMKLSMRSRNLRFLLVPVFTFDWKK